MLPRLQAEYPRLRLEVRETQTKLLLDELSGGELDCVMLALPVEGAEVETLRLFDGSHSFSRCRPTIRSPARARVSGRRMSSSAG